MPETHLMSRIASAPRLARHGRVVRVVGLVIEAVGVEMGVGDLCRLSTIGENTSLLAECVGFRDGGVLLMPYGELGGLTAGAMVEPLPRSSGIDVGPNMLGRVLDGLGRPIDGKGPI